jgi:alcohol dehydrogenase (NADP+)
MCAGITLYSPLKHWKAGPGRKVAIMGFGGLGHMGVKIACALGAQVTVLSLSLKKLEDAKRMGAHHFYATSDPKTFENLNGYFDLIVNMVSVELESVHEFAGTRWNDGNSRASGERDVD